MIAVLCLSLIVTLATSAPYAARHRPAPSPFDTQCSRKLSREAAAILRAEVEAPALRADVGLTQECLLNASRSVYAADESAKSMLRVGLWECKRCRKTFSAELFLDGHIHRSHVAIAQPPGAMCLAELCGLLGCPSLASASSAASSAALDEDAARALDQLLSVGSVDGDVERAVADASRKDDVDAAASRVPAADDTRRLLRQGRSWRAAREAAQAVARLSPSQARIATRCTEIVQQCLPHAAVDDDDLPSRSPRVLRRESAIEAAQQLSSRISDLRTRLVSTLCDGTPVVDRAAVRASAAKQAPLFIILYIVVAVVATAAILVTALICVDAAESAREKSDAKKRQQRAVPTDAAIPGAVDDSRGGNRRRRIAGGASTEPASLSVDNDNSVGGGARSAAATAER